MSSRERRGFCDIAFDDNADGVASSEGSEDGDIGEVEIELLRAYLVMQRYFCSTC
jgi:hypothetical protein